MLLHLLDEVSAGRGYVSSLLRSGASPYQVSDYEDDDVSEDEIRPVTHPTGEPQGLAP
jgi:hypothetical protein